MKKRFGNDDLLVVAGLCVLVLSAYWALQYSQFIPFDTEFYVIHNPIVKAGLTWDTVAWAFRSFEVANWHPLTWISHMVDTTLFGLEPAGHFIHNLLLHLANTLLLFWFVRQATSHIWGAALVAALFAVHPLNVENVAWIAQRKSLISTFWAFACMICYVRYVQANSKAAYAGALLCLAVSLLAKPMMVTMAPLLFLLDLWPMNRLPLKEKPIKALIGPAFRLIVEKIPFLILAVISSYLTVLAQGGSGAIQSISRITPEMRVGNVLISYFRYIYGLIWPKDLTIFYPHNYQMDPLWQVATAGALFLIIGLLAFLLLRRYPPFFVGWFWYVGTMVPVIGIVQVGEMTHADRYVYFPGIGLFILAVWGTMALLKTEKVRKAAFGFAVAVILAFTLVTRAQVDLWEDPEILFQHTLDHTTDNIVIQNVMGTIYYNRGDMEMALNHFLQASSDEIVNTRALRNASKVYYNWGLCDDAIRQLLKTAELEPKEPKNFLELANVYLDINEKEKARRALDYVTQIEPNNTMAFIRLARISAEEHVDWGLLYLEDALNKNADSPDIWREMGVLYTQKGEIGRAVEAYSKSLKLRPMQPETNYFLGRLYADIGNMMGARKQFEKEMEINPGHAETYHALAMTYILQNDLQKAGNLLLRAVELEPDLVVSNYELAFLFFQFGQIEKVEPYLKTVFQYEPDHLDANLLQAQVDLRQGQAQAVIDRLTRIQPSHPKDSNLLMLIGEAHLALDQREPAMAAYKESLQLNPRAPRAILGLASAYLADSDKTLRTKGFDLAKSANQMTGGKNPEAMNLMSLGLEQQGKQAEALALARQALDLVQNDEKLKETLTERIARLGADN
ncbi:MAG: tetratricopeptide repeat protein [Acidobacteriota bacterium]|nr:tetratricopeptide repeat protein [Acidobacteriota bacterium]